MEAISQTKRTVSVPIREYQAFTAWRSSAVSDSLTPLELVKHRRGLAEISQGNYVSLPQLKHELATLHRQSSQKKLIKVAKR